MIESATRAFLVMLRSLTRPRAVFTRNLPSRKSNHTGVTCGEPSGITVARCANDFLLLNRSRYGSGTWVAMAVLPGENVARSAADVADVELAALERAHHFERLL